MARIFNRIQEYFTQQPLPHTLFQISSRYVAGVAWSQKEKRIKRHFLLPLAPGIVEPSFDKTNIKEPGRLEEKLRDGLRRLHAPDGNIGCLIPDLCFKVFVFGFDSLPASDRERAELVRWRLKKQTPLAAEDLRISYDVITSNASSRVLVAAVRTVVVREYEDFFSRLRLRVRHVGIPSLNLLNRRNGEKDGASVIANIEEDYVSLMVVIGSGIVLYRLKSLGSMGPTAASSVQRAADVAKEIENTVHFIEDREKKKVLSLWLRLGLLEGEEEFMAGLRAGLSLKAELVESNRLSGLNPCEKRLLSPLVGLIA